jgi:hypothetical protein
MEKDLLASVANTEGDQMPYDRKIRRKNSRLFFVKCLLFPLLIVLLMLGAEKIILSGSNRKMDLTVALSNAKQVHMSLLAFEADYGVFPDDATAASTAKLREFQGQYSNDYLGQLVAGGYAVTEEVFYAHEYGKKRALADDVTDPPSRILEKNECGFSYVLVEDQGKRRGLRLTDRGDLPVLAAPLVNQWGSFEKQSYNGRGAIIRLDGSARVEPLRRSDQKVLTKEGGTLFDSGPGTSWNALKPVVLLPER